MTTTANRGYPKPAATDPVASGWDAIADLADAVDSDNAAQQATIDSLAGAGRTRIQAASVTLQANVNGRVYAPTGFAFNAGACTARVTRTISGTEEVDGMAITGYGGGAVYLAGGGAVAGNVVTVVVVDPA